MRKILVAAPIIGALAIPAGASAHRTLCANMPSRNIYEISGPSCATAKAVVNATESALLHGKLYNRTSYGLNVRGTRWHLTINDRNVSGTVPGTQKSYSQIEFFRATSEHRLVTFHSYGSN